MAATQDELAVFAWLPGQAEGRFVPAGLLTLSETVCANPQNRELASRFAYGLGYLKRLAAIEVDPVMLIRRFDRYWAAPGELPEATTALHDTRPGPGQTEGRLPYVSGLTLVACSEWESRNKGYHDLAHSIRQYVHPSRIQADAQELLARPGVAHERMLHLEVGDQGKLATLENALSRFAAFTPSRTRALEIIRRVWGEVRQWKTRFAAHGASDLLVDQLAGAFRVLEDIASPKLVGEIRGRGTL